MFGTGIGGSAIGVNFNKPKSSGGRGAEKAMIRDQRLPFMFEVLDEAGTVKSRYVLPIAPESYQLASTPRASVTMTKGGVHEDIVGNGVDKITMSGTFGFFGTLLPGTGARHIDGDKKDGWALFEELEKTFRDFYDEYQKFSGKPVFYFYDYTAKGYYRVQINAFTFKRDASRRMLVQYSLQMTVLDRIVPKIDEDTMLGLIKDLADYYGAADTANWLDSAFKAYAKANSFAYSFVGTIEQMKSAVNQIAVAVAGLRNQTSSVINAPFSLVSEVIASADSVIGSISSVNELPHEFTRSLRDIKRQMLVLTKEKALFVEQTETPAASTAASTSQSTPEIITGAKIEGSAGVSQEQIPEETLFATAAAPLALSSTVDPVLDGDSIQSIAGRNGADWQGIVSLNGLDAPFVGQSENDRYSPAVVFGTVRLHAYSGDSVATITFDGTVWPGDLLVFRSTPDQISSGDQYARVKEVDGEIITFEDWLNQDVPYGTTVSTHAFRYTILLPGDRVKVPTTAFSLNFSDGGLTLEQQLYGVDEKLDADGFMIATPTGDIETVSGIANLEAALIHRVNTARGELSQVSHPAYGSRLPEIVGKVANDMWRERALFEARLAAEQDPRIESAVESSFVADGTALYIDMKCTLVGKTSPEQFRLAVSA